MSLFSLLSLAVILALISLASTNQLTTKPQPNNSGLILNGVKHLANKPTNDQSSVQKKKCPAKPTAPSEDDRVKKGDCLTVEDCSNYVRNACAKTLICQFNAICEGICTCQCDSNKDCTDAWADAIECGAKGKLGLVCDTAKVCDCQVDLGN